VKTTVVAFVAAATVATAPLAAVSAQDPLKLALQRSDMPPTTVKAPVFNPSPHRDNPADLAILGVPKVTGASYSYTWPAGGQVNLPGLGPADKEWYLTGSVYLAPTQAAARMLFRYGQQAQHGFFADFPTDGSTKLTLPAYGDQQFALLGKDAGGPQAMVFARKRSVVWELRIGHGPPKWTLTKAQVLAQLKTYAAKQKARIGRG